MQINLKIEPTDVDLNDESYSKLPLTKEEKAQLAALFKELPSITGTKSESDTYTFDFPDDIMDILMKLSKGDNATDVKLIQGVSSFLLNNKETIVVKAALFTGMTLISTISSHSKLKKISTKLLLINEKLDWILDFLYGEKKSELFSEYTFINEALDNYSYIIQNETHRLATLTNIQESRKIAIKDVDFYKNDLHKIAETKLKEDEILKTKQNIDFSLQLYVMSSFLEIFYSMTRDKRYISNVKDNMISYVLQIEKDLFGELRFAQGKIHNAASSGKLKVPHTPGVLNEPLGCNKLDNLINELSLPNRPDSLSNIINNVFKNIEKEHKYFLTKSGDIYTD